jgi:superfamily II DNA/RNA helicase
LKNFQLLGISSPVLSALKDLNILEPTEIQLKAIPILIQQDCDFIGLAQTGTGKTAAFGLPLVEGIDPELRAVQALVITPTRELGQQVAQQLAAFSRNLRGVRVEVVYGGAPIYKQIQALQRRPQIVVATPGRLMDLMKRKAISLQNISRVVLDEADEMLNMGFKEDITHILSFTPASKKTWLFSATMPKEIRDIIGEFMTAPQEVSINSSQMVNANIEHQYIRVKPSRKAEALAAIMEENPNMRALIFCRTKNDTRDLAEDLYAKDIQADAIHGDLSQRQRDKVMRDFKAHKLQILVATDVAARGIHVNDLSHVIHYSMPDDMEFYTHRSGRTARAGKSGVSIAIIANRDFQKIRILQNRLKIDFTESTLDLGDAAEGPMKSDRNERGGGFEKRRSGGGDRRNSGGSSFRSSRGGSDNRSGNSYGRSNNSRPERSGPRSFGDSPRPERSTERSFSDSPRPERSANTAYGAGRPEGRFEARPERTTTRSYGEGRPYGDNNKPADSRRDSGYSGNQNRGNSSNSSDKNRSFNKKRKERSNSRFY